MAPKQSNRPQKTNAPGVYRLSPSSRYPNGGWLVRYRDDRNATLRKTFSSRGEALDFQASVRTDKRRGDYVNPKLATTPFRRVAESWLEMATSRLKPKTLAGYRMILHKHLLPAFGHRAIGKISAADIEAVLSKLNVTRGTQRNVLNVLNPIFKHAIKDGMLKSNPCSLVELPPVHRREMKFLTSEQVGQLADTVTSQYRTLVLTAAATGMRAGELAALRVRNLDLMRARIFVKESVADVGGKLHYGKPKTSKGVRDIGIPRDLVELLAQDIAGKNRDDLVFTGPNGAPLRHSNYYQRHFRRAVKVLVEEGTWPDDLAGLRFHDLRHTNAALLIDRGVHPKLIADRLGHTSISTTMNIYGHRFPDQEDAIAALLDDAFTRGSKYQPEAEVVSIADGG